MMFSAVVTYLEYDSTYHEFFKLFILNTYTVLQTRNTRGQFLHDKCLCPLMVAMVNHMHEVSVQLYDVDCL